MTADQEIPVYICEGSNWSCSVKLAEDDIDLPLKIQLEEAATKAIESLKGLEENLTLKITEENETPESDVYQDSSDKKIFYTTGPILRIYPKNTNPDETQKFVPSYIAFGNAGFYPESKELRKQYEKDKEVFEAATGGPYEDENEEIIKGVLNSPKVKPQISKEEKEENDGELSEGDLLKFIDEELGELEFLRQAIEIGELVWAEEKKKKRAKSKKTGKKKNPKTKNPPKSDSES
jgi:hypothetical protein